MNTGGVTYKQGVVSAAKPGFCRVRFDDLDGLATAWLPVIHHKTQDDKVIWTLDIGEHVACLMDCNMEDGCIVGAIYSEADTPPVASADKFRVQFKDGGSFEYDRSNGAMNVVCKGVANLTAGGAATVKATSITLDTPVATVNLTAGGAVTVKATSITLDTPVATCTGQLVVEGLLAYQGGMAGSGGGAATIQGNVTVQGDLAIQGDIKAKSVKTVAGIDLGNHHHTAQGSSAATTPAQN